MKLQLIAIGGIGHRVVPRGRSGKGDPRILPGRIIQGRTIKHFQNHTLDVVGRIFQLGNPALQAPMRMVGGFGIAAQPGHAGVGVRQRPAGQNETVRPLVRG
tara:strand:- start:567 stop:872 length:306 start_codon:yes stop_codon:yes gene_type:complete